MNTWQRFWQYVSECLRLLYWAFFKPFTFDHWLKQEIHPDLKFDDSPFLYRPAFAENPKLQRYADQTVWINLVAPLVLIGFVIYVYILVSGDTSIWSKSVSILIGWDLGILLSIRFSIAVKESDPVMVQLKFLIKLLLILMGMIIVVTLIGTGYGLESEMPFSIAFCLALGVLLGTVFAIAGGVVGSVSRGISFGIVGGIAVGIAFSVAGDMTFSLALTISWLLGVFRLYFWLPEALWTLVLRFRYPPQCADFALRWLPPHFDELIYLPLPFMSQLVTEAHRVNPAAARDTLDHFTNFTNQQTVVGHITRQIALDTLQSCQTEYDLAHVATDQLDWIPDPPPVALGEFLPKCLDISRDVRSAYEATTPYRHEKLLAKPIKDITQLCQQLGFENNAVLAPTLGQISQRWLAILETARRTLTEQIKQSDELPSYAYIAGPALDPNNAGQNFRGRQDIFAEIENLMLAKQPPVLLLYGGRRTGKTSALRYLPKRTGTDLVPLLVDLQGVAEASTLIGVAEGMAKQMIDFARTTRNMTLPLYDATALRQDPFFALRGWFEQIEEAFPNKRFLLCLDEFERLEEVVTATNSRAPLNFLRATFEHHHRWVLLFSGSHHPNELADYWSDYLINTQTVRLSYLHESEARELIEQPSADFPAQVYNSSAIDEIIYQTRCQPYLVQLLCQNVIEHLNRTKRQHAQKEDVTAAIPHALERGGEYFAELWKTTQKNAIYQVIIKKVLSQQPLTEEEKLRVPFLIDKEIVKITRTGYHFQVPLVEKFLRERPC